MEIPIIWEQNYIIDQGFYSLMKMVPSMCYAIRRGTDPVSAKLKLRLATFFNHKQEKKFDNFCFFYQ